MKVMFNIEIPADDACSLEITLRYDPPARGTPEWSSELMARADAIALKLLGREAMVAYDARKRLYQAAESPTGWRPVLPA